MSSKLAGYPEDQQVRIKATFSRLLEGRVNSGKVEESEAAIKAAMPTAFAEACQAVVTIDACMSRLTQYPEPERQRIRSIAEQLVEGQLIKGKIAAGEHAVADAARVAVNDARRVVTAVDEYLCG